MKKIENIIQLLNNLSTEYDRMVDKALWYSGHGLRLLHRLSQFDSHSRRFTWQVNEPSPGSTHALWGKLGSQSKVLTGHWLTVSIIAKNGLLSLMQCNHIHISKRWFTFRFKSWFPENLKMDKFLKPILFSSTSYNVWVIECFVFLVFNFGQSEKGL